MRQYLLLEGFTSALDYRNVTDLLEQAAGWTCALVYAVLLGTWIAAFFGPVRGARDKYRRYRLYRQWIAGLIFLLANGFVLLLKAGFPTLGFPLSPCPNTSVRRCLPPFSGCCSTSSSKNVRANS